MIDDWEFFYNGWFDDTNTLDTVESEDEYFDTTNTLSDGEHSCDSKTTAKKKAIKSDQNYVTDEQGHGKRGKRNRGRPSASAKQRS